MHFWSISSSKSTAAGRESKQLAFIKWKNENSVFWEMVRKLQKRCHVKAFKLHGEAGEVPQTVVDKTIDHIHQTIPQYSLRDVLNCDELGLLFQKAPDLIIATSSFAGRKDQKARSTFLAFCNTDGMQIFPLMFKGNAQKLPCFNTRSGEHLELYYRNNKKAWMNSSLFSSGCSTLTEKLVKSRGLSFFC